MSTTRTLRKTSLTAGILYLLTFVSIPTLALYGPVHKPDYFFSQGAGTGILIGGLLEIIVALAAIGTAVVLYPVLKVTSETAALALVTARVLEATTIFLGVAFLLTAITLPHYGNNTSGMATISRALVVLYDRIFLLGQSCIPAINDLLLGYLLYRSRLVPRTLALAGMLGALPLIIGYLMIFFGYMDRNAPMAMLSAAGVAIFEFLLGICLVVRGFRQQARA